MANEFFRLPAENGVLNFNVLDEARKLHSVITSDPQPHATLCSYDDMLGFPFEPSDIGFFIILMPGRMAKQGGNFTFAATAKRQEESRSLLAKLRVDQFQNGLLIASTACSWDTAMARIQHIGSLQYAAVAFSTPERFQVIAENPIL
jgi:hypothetical protein